MKKQLWHSLTAMALLSTIGMSEAVNAQSSAKAERQNIQNISIQNISEVSPHETRKNTNKLPRKSSRLAFQGIKNSGGSYNEGWASWYGPGFDGNYTASGEVFNQYEMTAAHPSLPFGTLVQVTNLDNGASVTVRINDRGPFGGGRIIDLSAGAAEALGMIYSGEAYVALEVLN
jgi:rare lipoprotein A